MDGNQARRRLGLYKLGYRQLDEGNACHSFSCSRASDRRMRLDSALGRPIRKLRKRLCNENDRKIRCATGLSQAQQTPIRYRGSQAASRAAAVAEGTGGLA
jgi:hypothetical protein